MTALQEYQRELQDKQWQTLRVCKINFRKPYDHISKYVMFQNETDNLTETKIHFWNLA